MLLNLLDISVKASKFQNVQICLMDSDEQAIRTNGVMLHNGNIYFLRIGN
jgi:hypothetical protein